MNSGPLETVDRPAPVGAGAVLSLAGVTKRYGNATALDGVSLAVRRGELFVVVGPSGCGKTTLLQAVAGLIEVDGGEIAVDGRSVVGQGRWVPPEDRRVGVVFQEHALFPHLTVAGNVEFGLRRNRAARRNEVLDLVRLGHLADRYPHELSGGEQQRVALARALAPAPAVLLLDEPFSSLDANLRADLRRETAEVLRASGATAVFVTHDQQEALSIGDRMAVLRAGRIEQCAEPATAFHAPATPFVATFLGEADLLPGTATTGTANTLLGHVEISGPATSGPVDVMVRPHEITLSADPSGNAEVVGREFRGGYVLHTVALDSGGRLRAELLHPRALPVGTRVSVHLDPGHPVAAFPRASGVRETAPGGHP